MRIRIPSLLLLPRWLPVLLVSATLAGQAYAQEAGQRQPQAVTSGAHAFLELMASLPGAGAAVGATKGPDLAGGQAGQVVALMFTAPWCRRCGKAVQRLDSLPAHAALYRREVAAGTAAGDALHQAYNIQRVPTLVVMAANGQEVARRQGGDALDPQVVEQELQRMLQDIAEVRL